MQGLRKKKKQITVQSISLTMAVEGTMVGDTAKGKIRTNNMHGMGNKQTQIIFYGNKSLTCSI